MPRLSPDECSNYGEGLSSISRPKKHQDEFGFTEDAGHPVDKIEQFDFDSIDSLKSKVLEAMAQGNGALTHLVSDYIERQGHVRSNEAIARIICLIADARRPRLIADQLAWISGMSTSGGLSLPALARRNRITKQAFSQAAIRLANKLGLRPSRAMRSLKARRSMSIAYRQRQQLTRARVQNRNASGRMEVLFRRANDVRKVYK